uniref:DUF4050 domain-containing protein n=1 Tax=Cryptomonas curvata TaxID=233186 RepID=A0A7S0M231_9CRYP|mmetsp:Transcript_17556/g.37074  ORF Transcript_17556/g.37074 Transcript_17556/m.37074 type:complete len:107 (+) Transcript_17556:80-400(+)
MSQSSSTDSFDADDVVAKGGTVRSEEAWDRVRAGWQKQSSDLDLKREQEGAAAKRAASARRAAATSVHEIERCLDTGEAFPQPVPLSSMVDLLMELWEDEGLFDKF